MALPLFGLLMNYFWGAVSSILAIALETSYKRSEQAWLELLPYTIVPILLLNYTLCRLIRGSDTLLTAFIVFALCNSIGRVLVCVFVLKENPSGGIWVALAMVFAANLIKGLWK